jgi:hypothetical protein
LLPRLLVRGQEPLVGEQNRAAGGVEVVPGVDRGPQVPGESADVADDEDVPALAGAGEHLAPLASRGDRPPRVRHLPSDARVDELVPLDRSVLVLALGVGPEAVDLAGRALPDPPGGAEPAELVDRPRESLHGAQTLQTFTPRPSVRRPRRHAS